MTSTAAAQASTASSSLLNVKNPAYNHSVPGIYLFKQNGLEQEYFWLELYADGTGISAQTLGNDQQDQVMDALTKALGL